MCEGQPRTTRGTINSHMYKFTLLTLLHYFSRKAILASGNGLTVFADPANYTDTLPAPDSYSSSFLGAVEVLL